jgi:hypothetical protein
MQEIFKVGMEVYDQVFFPDTSGKIVKIHNKNNRVLLEAKFFSKERLDPLCMQSSVFYTEEGYIIGHFGCDCKTPTLSTKSYKIILDGFEQKALTPTYEDALDWLVSNKDYETFSNNYEIYPSNDILLAFKALRKLIILREYYNEGWQPNWNESDPKYCINTLSENISHINSIWSSKVLTFKTSKIRDRFLEEQKELIEIAKPLI